MCFIIGFSVEHSQNENICKELASKGYPISDMEIRLSKESEPKPYNMLRVWSEETYLYALKTLLNLNFVSVLGIDEEEELITQVYKIDSKHKTETAHDLEEAGISIDVVGRGLVPISKDLAKHLDTVYTLAGIPHREKSKEEGINQFDILH